MERQQAAAERQRRENNAQAAEKTAQNDYPHETWLDAGTVKLRYVELPENLAGVRIAESKFPMNKSDEETLLKEVNQAKILSGKGASVYLIPKLKDHTGRSIPGPDAIVNGRYTEFKTITGTIGKVEKHFRDSRKQGESVYIRITRENITKDDVLRKLRGVVHDKKYTGGYKGNVIFTVGQGKDEKTYTVRIKDLKR